ncbi:hypothetical protein AWC02_09950 [Mycolicibacter engbaekii]|uniref:PE-PGRS family protein n=1 Tax=Mycolicibacter engbaekii TaxID=188915 RepID=A0A1X1TRI8_9MYCO|nr:hypothetical protein [Mycolicibacter engbaekii]ORV47180.1 hypothetical protein AWC02_09950 [Mycolicibacter engbaekii]
MEFALHPDAAPRRAGHATRLAAAGIALAGAGLVAVHPVAPSQLDIRHQAVQLTSGIEGFFGWSSVFERTAENLSTLFSNANVFDVIGQAASNWGDYAQLIIGMEDVPLDAREGMEPRFVTSGFAGIGEAFEKMIFGVEGQDVKYPGLEVLLERIGEALANGNPFEAFNELNIWTLYGIEDIGKALGPVLSIPAREMENISTLFNEFIGPLDAWAFIKAVSQTMMAPMIGVFYQFAETLTNVLGGDFEALLSAPADLVNTLVNGYEVPVTEAVFVGLINNDSIFDLLLVDWPARAAEALTVGTADLPVNAVEILPASADFDLFGADFLSSLFDGSIWDAFAG